MSSMEHNICSYSGDSPPSPPSRRSKHAAKMYTAIIIAVVLMGLLVGLQNVASPRFFDLPTMRQTRGSSAPEKADPWEMRGGMPCHPENATDPQGLYYVSIPKSDNGYWNFIFDRARERMKSIEERDCYHLHLHHQTYMELGLEKRHRDETFVVSFLREPRDHSIRKFIFGRAKAEAGKDIHRKRFETYSRYLEKAYDYLEVRFLEHNHARNARIYSSSLDQKQQRKMAKISAREILAQYDFIGIVERPSESLVALQFILNWTADDVLYIPTRNIRTMSYFVDKNNTCHSSQQPLVEKHRNESVYESWKPHEHLWSLALYRQANKKLNATIEAIGKAKFQRALIEHERLMASVRRQCLPLYKSFCDEAGEKARSHQEVDSYVEAVEKCMETL